MLNAVQFVHCRRREGPLAAPGLHRAEERDNDSFVCFFTSGPSIRYCPLRCTRHEACRHRAKYSSLTIMASIELPILVVHV